MARASTQPVATTAARRRRAAWRPPTGALLAAPAVVLLAAVFVAAMATLLEFSFHHFEAGARDTSGTFATWAAFLGDSYSWGVVRTTATLGAATVAGTVLVGYPTAWALHRLRNPRWRAIGYFIVFAPLMTSVVARSYGWMLVLGDAGFVNGSLGAVGLDRPLALLYQFPGVLIALVHILLPFVVFPVLSSLRQVDASLGEAAADLGASGWAGFRRVTLPLTLPGVLAGAQLVFALSISAFATPSLLGGGRVQVLATQVYDAVGNLDWPLAAVASYVLLAMALAALALFGALQRRRAGGEAASRPPRPLRGRARLAAGLWLGLVDAFVLLPLAIIVVGSFSSVAYGTWPPPGWSLRWYQNLAGQEGLGAAVLLSLVVAAAATALSLLVGTLVALAVVRHRFAGRRALEPFTLSPMVVPKVAFGFAAFIYLHRLGLFGSTAGLVAAHVVITLPFVVILLVAALSRADATLDEAAMDLGATTGRAFRLATMPQIRPALLAAAVFAFVVSFDEVDMTVFLLGTGQDTLPTWMYVYTQKYQDPTLAALSTLLIAGSLALAAVAAVVLGRSGLAGALTSRGGARQPDRGAPR